MAIFKRQANPELVKQGMSVNADRPLIPADVGVEILEANQQVVDSFWPSLKIKSLEVGKLTTGSLRVSEYIQSTGFVAGTSGWQIKGNGDATFNNVTLYGGILRYGKVSFTDTFNAGYYISQEGFYFGSSLNTNFLKYDISTGAITTVGTFLTAGGTGKRIVMSSVTSDLSFYDSVNHQRLKLGGTADTNVIFVDDNGNNAYPSLDFRRSVGTGSSVYIQNETGTGHCIDLLNNSNTPAQHIVSSGTGAYVVPQSLTNNTVVSTVFYKMAEHHGSTAVTIEEWIANNATPQGALTAPKGSTCRSSNGNFYVNQDNSTTWKVATLT